MTGARNFNIWGTGSPRREFLHVDDCADAIVFLTKMYSAESQVNVGSGQDISVLELARLVACTVGFDGKIVCDLTMPDGTPKKLINSDKIFKMGWQPKITLPNGIRSVYRWFLDNCKEDSMFFRRNFLNRGD